MDTIFIVTEANERVATGHLMECIVCAKELIEIGYAVSFWVNNDAGSELKRRIPCQFHEYHSSIEEDYRLLIKELLMVKPKVIVFNLREISEEFLKEFKEKIPDKIVLICIDEFGHRHLASDIIVNPMIDSYYWDYGESRARLFCGAEYLILPKELELYHKKEKIIKNKIQNIVITMGGVDPKNYTLRLIEIVLEYFSDAIVNVVVGGGNQHYEDIKKRADKRNKIMIVQNIPNTNLLEMMYEADLVVCAGGNTLHEAACIGTPAVVLPSMPHEERTAKCFEKKGFGLMVHTEHNWEMEILKIFSEMKSYQRRSSMGVNGKNISDGMGRKRMVGIIKELTINTTYYN